MIHMKVGYMIGLVVVVLLGIGAIALATELVQQNKSADTSVDTTTQVEDPPENEDDRSLPEAADVGDKEEIQTRINQFVSVYYGRSADLYAGSLSDARNRLADRLRPYVTDEFLVGYLPPLDTPPDIWNKRTGAEIRARVDPRSVVGHFEDSTSAEETLRVVITPVIDGVKQSRRSMDIALALVYAEGAWRVDRLEEMYL